MQVLSGVWALFSDAPNWLWGHHRSPHHLSRAPRLLSSRLPEQAVVVQLDRWLSPCTRKTFNAAPSDCSAVAEETPKTLCVTTQREWHAVVRRLFRCGLGRALPANTAQPWRAAGTSAVRKD